MCDLGQHAEDEKDHRCGFGTNQTNKAERRKDAENDRDNEEPTEIESATVGKEDQCADNACSMTDCSQRPNKDFGEAQDISLVIEQRRSERRAKIPEEKKSRHDPE